MSNEHENYLLVDEVANRLRVSKQSVRLWIKNRKITAVRPAKFWLIPECEVERMIAIHSTLKN
ncbi:MAG: helix-turn-helix domain-containing protein [Salinivirgaceae bacterium]|nr:helix-turn-helix domain-containing protein [Salinivirgaceae bacterium]